MSVVIIQNGKATTIQPSKQMTGEKIPGDLKTWDYMGTNPNDILLLGYDKLSQRSTTLYHTHPPVAAAVNKQTSYAIGTGLRFRSQPDWQILGIDKEAAKDWGMRFQKLLHYMFVLLNFYEKQTIMFRTGLVMGDSLLAFDRNYTTDNLPFDLVEMGGDQIDFHKYEENKIKLGIYHDSMLRKQAVHLYDGGRVDFRDGNGDQNILQYYNKLIARQLRGYPLAYRVIAAAKNNDRWWDATLARVVMESIIFATSEGANTQDTRRQMETLHETLHNEDGTTKNNLKRDNVSSLGPGNVLSYRKGEGMKFTDLKTPSNNFDKMQTAYIEMVGMGTDTPAECIASKYSTSFTAHKGALNDFKKSYEQKRHGFARTICHPVIREIAKYLFLNNYIEMPAPGFFTNPIVQEATLSGTWLGPVPGHVNPKQEVDALVVAKDNAFITPADAAATFSNVEWDDQIEEWSQQMAEWQKLAPDTQAQKIGEEMDEEADRDVDDEPEEPESPQDNTPQEDDE